MRGLHNLALDLWHHRHLVTLLDPVSCNCSSSYGTALLHYYQCLPRLLFLRTSLFHLICQHSSCLCMWCCLAEVVEHCCSIPSLQLGETLPNIAKDMDTHTYRIPLGVTAGITPFNFPAMIPLWVNNKKREVLLNTVTRPVEFMLRTDPARK